MKDEAYQLKYQRKRASRRKKRVLELYLLLQKVSDFNANVDKVIEASKVLCDNYTIGGIYELMAAKAVLMEDANSSDYIADMLMKALKKYEKLMNTFFQIM